jgi:hypothetical protein
LKISEFYLMSTNPTNEFCEVLCGCSLQVLINMVIWDEQEDTRAQAWGCLGASQEYIQEDTII